MKIVYNKKSDIYQIDLEYPETQLCVQAENIAEAKDIFIAHMSWLFEESLREQLKD